MISGNITLEDITIGYTCQDGKVTYSVEDSTNDVTETFIVPQGTFFKALAIAVHNDGEPDYRVDYPAAESIMGTIRWIP